MICKTYWKSARAETKKQALSAPTPTCPTTRRSVKGNQALSDELGWSKTLRPLYKKCAYSSKKIDTYFRSVITDQKRRGQFEKTELEKQIVRSILMSDQQSKKTRYKSSSRLARGILALSIYRKFIKPKGTITRVRNRCILSGRSSTIGQMSLSRIRFRKFAGFGKIPGLLKI